MKHPLSHFVLDTIGFDVAWAYDCQSDDRYVYRTLVDHVANLSVAEAYLLDGFGDCAVARNYKDECWQVVVPCRNIHQIAPCHVDRYSRVFLCWPITGPFYL